jgi:hypothetical protein
LERDFRSPRQSARKPGIELAPPTSTPNSVREATSSGAAADEADSGSSDAFGATEATSGVDADGGIFGSEGGSSNFPAAGSGGAMIDFDATSEPDGWAALACGSIADFADEPGSDVTAVAACLSCLAVVAAFSATAGAVVATAAAIGAGVGFTTVAEGSIDAVVAGAAGRGGVVWAASAEGAEIVGAAVLAMD